MARPDMLTEERHKTAIDCFKQGDSQIETAYILGISIGTLEGWNRRGIKDLDEGLDTKYSRFVRDTKKATAFKARERRKNIENDDSWQSDAWILERMFPRIYGRAIFEFEELKEIRSELKQLIQVAKEKASGKDITTDQED